MNKFRIIFVFFSIVLLSGCTALQDIDYSKREDYNFEVEEIKLTKLVESDELLQERSKELEAIKEQLLQDTAVQAQETANWFVVAPSLNVRSLASSDASLLGALTLGEEIVQKAETIGDDGERWIEFEYEGTTAFVAARYLSKDVADDPIAIYRVVIYTLNVREEPSEESEILGELTYFTEFTVFEKVTDANGKVWLKTMAPGSGSGYGYVMSDYAVVVSEN